MPTGRQESGNLLHERSPIRSGMTTMIQSALLSSFPSIRHAFTVKDHMLNGIRDELIIPTQTHDDTVVSVFDTNLTVVSDGLLTAISDVPIGVVTADCVPLLLFDPDKHIVGAVHAGRKGTLKHIAYKAVTSMVDLGSSFQSIRAAIGPAIKSCCYDIPPDRTQLFIEKFGTKSVIKSRGINYIDLQKINYQQLLSCGLSDYHIDLIPECTKCNDAYYSYRRGDRDKRMVSYIYLV